MPVRSGAHRVQKLAQAQNQERLDLEKGQLTQLQTELTKLKKEMETNKHQLAETKEKLSIQRNELALASTALIKEKETANQMDIKLTQEIELLDHLHTAVQVQKNELLQLESDLEHISSMSEQLDSQKANLEQFVTEHQQESNKLERLTQLQQEKLTLDGLTKEYHKETAAFKQDEFSLKNQQDKKQLVEAKKSEMTEELNKIQQETAKEEKNKSLITRFFNAITSFFKSIFGSASNKGENSLATQKAKEIEQLQAEIGQLDNSIEQQEKIIQNQKVNVDGLEKRIKEQSSRVQSIQDSVDVNDDLNKEIEKQTKKVDRLATEIIHSEQDIEQLKKAETDSHIKVRELTGNISRQKKLSVILM